MSSMTRDTAPPGVPAPGTPLTREWLHAQAADLLIDASRSSWVNRRRHAIANAVRVGLPMTRAIELLEVARRTVYEDIKANAEATPTPPRSGVAEPPPRITYMCCACGQPIKAGMGIVYCPNSEIVAVTERAASNAERGTVGTLADVLDDVLTRARWRARHLACEDLIDEDIRYGYELDVEQIDTVEKLLTWQNHLWGKRWFPRTLWDAFLAEHVIPSLKQQGMPAAGR